MLNFAKLHKLILIKTFIIQLVILLALNKNLFSNVPENTDHQQKNDSLVTIRDIQSDKGIISRFLLNRVLIDYSLSTNNEKNELLINLPFKIKDEKTYIPEDFKSENIELVQITTNTENKSVISIKLTTSNCKFIDYPINNPAGFVIDFWNPQNIKSSTVPNQEEIIAITIQNTEPTKEISKKLPEKTKKESLESLKKEPIKQLTKTQIKPEPELINKIDSTSTDEKIIKTRKERMLYENEKLYLPFEPLRYEIRLPLDKPEQFEINGTEEDQKLYNIALNLYKNKKYALAIKSVDLFIKEFSDSKLKEEIHFLRANINYALAKHLSSKNYFDIAISHYKEALRLFPTSQYVPQTLMFIGVSYFNMNQYYKALGSFEVGADKYSENKYTLLMRLGAAEIYFKLKDYNSAINRLSVLMKEFTDTDVARDASFRLGDVYFEKNDYENAIKSYISAIELWPDDLTLYPNALFNMAEAYFWQAAYPESLKIFKDFLKLFSKYIRQNENIYIFGSNALVRIAEIMDIMGAEEKEIKKVLLETEFRFRGAYGSKIAALRRITMDIRNVKSNKELNHLYREIDKIIKESKNEKDLIEFAKIIKGESLFERKSYQDAIKNWENHIINNPQTKYLTRLKSHITKALKIYIESEIQKENYHMALRLYHNNRAKYFTDDNSFEIMFKLVEAYINLALFDDAKTYLERSINGYKKYVRQNKKIKKARLENPAKDINHLKSLSERKMKFSNETIKNEMSFIDTIKITPENYQKIEDKIIVIHDFEIDYVRAHLEKEKGNYENGEKICRRAIEKYEAPEKLKFIRLLGDIFTENKKWQDAIKTYSQIDIQDPHTLMNFAYALEKAGNKKEALGIYKNISDKRLVDDQRLKKIKYKIPKLYFLSDDFKNAEKFFRDYIKDFPNDENIHYARYELGKSLFKLNNLEAAVKEWTVLSKIPDAGVLAQLADESIKSILWKQKFERQLR